MIIVLLCAFIVHPEPATAQKTIKTLIVTGQNNHNWKVSSVVMERILENSGLFTVDVAVSPEKV